MDRAFLDNPLNLGFWNTDQPTDFYVVQFAQKNPAPNGWGLKAEPLGDLIDCLELICHLFHPLQRTNNVLSPLVPAVRGVRGANSLN